MSMKRSRDEGREVEALAMANCVMLLSQIGKTTGTTPAAGGRVFKCKTCNRQFPSFQALGGHRASHKRPKLMAAHDFFHQLPVKPKKHECSICGVEFALGQALGGHMRRHRAAMDNSVTSDATVTNNSVKAVPFLERCNSSKRVLSLDLNLMPYDIDLKLGW